MQIDLIPNDEHSAGGKSCKPRPAGVSGDAAFRGDRKQYRPYLRRWVGSEAFPARFVLFIGMNPSVADGRLDDNTVAREWGFATREGFSGYLKCNVSDYRATHPKDLLVSGLQMESLGHCGLVVGMAQAADLVVAAWGDVNRALKPMAARLEENLRSAGVEMHCLGRAKSGMPRHPLYRPKDALIEPYP